MKRVFWILIPIKKMFFIASFMIIGMCLFSQSMIENLTPKVIPPDPQSLLYQQYVDCPVSYETGVPEIVIPLYEIEIEGLIVPINLSYHASGIRFNQYDGDLGVGWVLNPGYRVTRTVYGQHDEDFNRHPDADNDPLFIASSKQTPYLRDRYLAEFSTPPTVDGVPWPWNYQFYDSEHDHFCYMLPGGSAHFIIPDKTKQDVVIFEKSNYKITRTLQNSQIGQFNIIDDNGFRYLMGMNLQKTALRKQYDCRLVYPVEEITSPKGQKIIFDYVGGGELHTYFGKAITMVYDMETDFPNVTQAHFKTDYSPYHNYLGSCLLSEINTDKEQIKIYRNSNYLLNQRIQSIEIYSKIPALKLMKKIEFVYSKPGNHTMLDEVKIYGENIIDNVESYKFTYYDGPKIGEVYCFPDEWNYYKKISQSANLSSYTFYHKEFENDRYGGGTSNWQGTSIGVSMPILVDRRENQTEALHGYSLKSITFPTKGRWEFEYEPNRYLRYELGLSRAIYGGGQRIKKIIMYDGQNKVKALQYKYGNNETGLGLVSFDPTPNHFADEICEIRHKIRPLPCIIDCEYIESGLIRRYSTNILGNASIDRHFYIYYPEVVEYQYDENNNSFNGKTVRTYQIYEDRFTLADVSELPTSQLTYSHGTNFRTGAYIGEYKYGMQPLLTSKSVYSFKNNDYHLVHKEDFKYEKNMDNEVFNEFSIRITCFNQVSSGFTYEESTGTLKTSLDPYHFVPSFFSSFSYNLYAGRYLLTQKTETDYFPQGNVTKIYHYAYNDKLQIKNVKFYKQDNNELLITENKYPQEFATGNNIYYEMVANNMITPFVEQITFYNSVETKRIKTDYFKDTQKTNGIIQPEKIQISASGTAGLRTDILFDLYDTKGNLRQFTTIDGIRTVYLWGYNYQYPIAEIKGATYSEVTGKIAETTLNTIAAKNEPTTSDFTTITNLRSQLPNAQVTTYTYKPLIGMQTMTDPRGVVTKYDYDNFGRLNKVTQADKVIETYNYNYKN